jgi:hypothetical protein
MNEKTMKLKSNRPTCSGAYKEPLRVTEEPVINEVKAVMSGEARRGHTLSKLGKGICPDCQREVSLLLTRYPNYKDRIGYHIAPDEPKQLKLIC